MTEQAKEKLCALGYSVARHKIGDPFRICIYDKQAHRLYRHLCERGVVCEYADDESLIAIPSVMTSERDFEAFVCACAGFKPSPTNEISRRIHIPESVEELRTAVFAPSDSIETAAAHGRVSARVYAVYPPGVPMIMPGEIFGGIVTESLRQHGIK